MANLDREEFDEEMDRREFRRKRRVQNQVIAYISAVIMLAVILAGAGLGIHKGITAWNDKKEAQELQAQIERKSGGSGCSGSSCGNRGTCSGRRKEPA